MKRMTPEISVIIVNYKADEEVARIKKSLLSDKNIEVIVIDHSDGKNGFGSGCNTGAYRSKGETLLFINPDVSIHIDTVLTLHEFLVNHPHVGMVGPQIKDDNNKIVITCSKLPNPVSAIFLYTWLRKFPIGKRIETEYRLDNFSHRTSRPVPSLSGSCFAMRRDDFLQISGCDENLFLYFEEFDLAQKVQSVLQKSIYFLSSVCVQHTGQVSTKKASNIQNHFFHSRHYYMQKYYGLFGIIADYWIRSQEILAQLIKRN